MTGLTLMDGIFGSDRSPRRGNVVCPSVRVCVRDIIQKNIENELKQHSKESWGVLGQASRQAGKQVSKQASKQASKQIRKHPSKQVGRKALWKQASKGARRQAGNQASR